MNKHRPSFHRKITIKYSVSTLLEWRREKVGKKLKILLPRRQTSGKLIKITTILAKTVLEGIMRRLIVVNIPQLSKRPFCVTVEKL
jgi:hypothetical protein